MANLTYEEAVKMLPDGAKIHTFRNPNAGMLIGADWRRFDLIDALSAAKEIYTTYGRAKAMGHGLAFEDAEGRTLFVETKKEEGGR